MQKQKRSTTLARTGTLRMHGTSVRRPTDRRLAAAFAGAALLVGVLVRSAAGSGPGESP